MFVKFKIDKRHVKNGIYIVVVGLLLFIGYKIIDNGNEIINSMINVVDTFFDIISPIIYAFILSYLLFRPVIYIQEKLQAIYKSIKKKDITKTEGSIFRMLSIVIIFALIIGVISLTINFVLPPIIENIKILINKLPEYKDQIVIWVDEIIKKLNENNIDISSTGKVATDIVNKLTLFSNTALAFITASITGISVFVLDFVLTLIFTFYFLKDKEALFNTFRRFRDVIMPGKVGKNITLFLNDLDEIVGKFLLAEILDCIIVGIASTILLLLIKHPFAILIGTIAGVTNIIPYVGPVIGAALAFGLGVFTSWGLGIGGAILLLLYQQVDGNFIQPKIVGDRIGLTPVWILIVVLIGGSYFGAMGMILSMPVAGLIRIYFNRYAKWKEEKDKYKLS